MYHVRNVTDQVSNPFGMRPPCQSRCEGSNRRAVFGYGDANADFHVIGDNPGLHGGVRTGVPFTDSNRGERILDVLEVTGFLSRRQDELVLSNCFLSYLYLCCLPPNETVPSDEDYGAFERFFDAELRAIAADVLLPVGFRVTDHVVTEYTAKGGRLEIDMAHLHGAQIKGRGFIVVPVKDPSEWADNDEERLVDTIDSLLETDYEQLVDLGRFLPHGDPYFVR